MNYKVQKYKISYVKENDSIDKAILENRIISNQNDVHEFVKKYLSQIPIEQFCVIALSTSNKIIGFTCAVGTVNQAAVYPREVFSFLFSSGAACFIIAHNHPGNSLQPSESDWNIVKKLKMIGEGLDVQLLDSVIVTDDEMVSMRSLSRWDVK